MLSLIDENYISQNLQDFYDAILNTLFSIILIAMINNSIGRFICL
ncbi:43743_t:CDS:2 [Gigaspora margarita]|uniref:43743_t:CDS:1 n=1 Tax=Gigaspora margarita TaxID=4874 RepID=A0ABN7UE66_GIGMA|nr:43743_t:CDS:2 [Gigaspora margarita]